MIEDEERNVNLVFATLEDAIRGTDEPLGIETGDNEIVKGDDVIGIIEESKEVDPLLIEKIKKVMGQ